MTVRALELATQPRMQVRAAVLPNGARLMCSAVGVFEPDNIRRLLPHADLAMFNYGLHYQSEAGFRDAMAALFEQLAARLALASDGARVRTERRGEGHLEVRVL